MTAAPETPNARIAYNAYYKPLSAQPDLAFRRVDRGTPSGEYLRRFWQPVAYEHELGELPLRARALGEDLVIFRDKSGRIGCLLLNCCHRNTSLEYGIISDRGIRCCYHGRLFDVDGTILEIPGEPNADRLKTTLGQGAYPTHVFGGIVFIYMGPPDEIPVFPMLDRYNVPNVKLVPGVRWDVDCNWLQLIENGVDPAHTATLHAIPQLRGMEHFAHEFGAFPDIMTYFDTPGGIIYMAARRVENNVWVRTSEIFGANMIYINSIFESGQTPKPASLPFLTFWFLPIDNEKTVRFFVSHVADDEEMPFEKRRYLENFGQTGDRPYAERQYLPGDHEAMLGQGTINDLQTERLGTHDRGISMFRRGIRASIDAVEQGRTPKGYYRTQSEVPHTFANDRVMTIGDAPEIANGNRWPDFADRVMQDYLVKAPMEFLVQK